MKTRTYTVIIHPADLDESGYWVEVPALPGCFTQGETFDKAVAHVHEAIEGRLRALADAGEPIPGEPAPSTQSKVTTEPDPVFSALDQTSLPRA